MIDRIEQILVSRRVILITFLWAIGVILMMPFRALFPFDDTYITFHYAHNLAHGLGLVWNAGGAHTEGYTNFLFVVLLAPFSALGADLVGVAQWVCLLAVLGTAFTIERIVRTSLRQLGWVGVAAAALYLTDVFVWYNALSALETSVFVFFVLLAFDSLQRDSSRRMFIYITLAALTRPEGALLAMVCVGILIALRRGDSRNTLRNAALFFVLPMAVYAIWKLFYFGDLLPNSFHVKVAQQPFSPMNGGGTVKNYFIFILPLPILALLAFIPQRGQSKQPTAVLIAMGSWILALGLFYMFSSLLQPDYDRFMQSFEACMIVMTIIGLANISTYLTRAQHVVLMLTFLVLMYAQFKVNWGVRYGHSKILHDTYYDDRYIRIAELFHTIPHAESITFAWGDAGMLPYYSGMKHIDIVGLNTNEIARAKTTDEALDYLAKARPDIIFIPTEHRIGKYALDTCLHPIDWGHGIIGRHYDQILKHKGLDGYVDVVTLPHLAYDLNVMVDARSSHFDDIEKTLTAAIGKPASRWDSAAMVLAPACCIR